MKLVRAHYHGIQRGFGLIPDFELWTPLVEWEGHPVGSTVSRQTMEQMGYVPQEVPRDRLAERGV
jgi:hypothetical protein